MRATHVMPAVLFITLLVLVLPPQRMQAVGTYSQLIYLRQNTAATVSGLVLQAPRFSGRGAALLYCNRGTVAVSGVTAAGPAVLQGTYANLVGLQSTLQASIAGLSVSNMTLQGANTNLVALYQAQATQVAGVQVRGGVVGFHEGG
jgi:hypothetical protein